MSQFQLQNKASKWLFKKLLLQMNEINDENNEIYETKIVTETV